MSVLAPGRRRPLAALVAASIVFVVVAVGCGVDTEGIEVSTGSSTTAPTSGTTQSTDGTAGTTGTTEDGPRISLPDIPPDVTDPDDTAPDSSEPETTVPSTDVTPGGLTHDDFQQAMVDQAHLSPQQGACVADGVFAEFSGDVIDQVFSADDVAELDPTVVDTFTEIVQTCVQGG